MTPITKVVIEVIPHLAQRYETCGDWFRTIDNGKATLRIYCSKLGSDIDPFNLMSLCVGYHELSEALACIANGIKEKDVDEFDMNYHGNGEPGDCPEAPYVHQHNWASGVEKQLLVMMGFFWSTYEKAINRLFKKGTG
jgi:hypothetical protein